MVNGLFLFFCGFCMGAADLVPGISGGTIAFIMGVYPTLIHSLKSFNLNAFKLLFKGDWKGFLHCTEWKFLMTLLSGIVSAFAVLSGGIHGILAHEIYRSYLYAAFFGLILASFFLCVRHIRKWNGKRVLGFLVGVLCAYYATSKLPDPIGTELSNYGPGNGWILFSGAAAICAMLLPGVSGSYVLTLMGVYPVFIGSLANFFGHLRVGLIDWEAVSVLAYLGLGIVLGVLLFSRLLSWLLNNYPDMSIAILSGFMIGGLRAVWPDWESIDAFQGIMWMVLGFVCVFGLEMLRGGRKTGLSETMK